MAINLSNVFVLGSEKLVLVVQRQTLVVVPDQNIEWQT